jgi:uncharacterized protein
MSPSLPGGLAGLLEPSAYAHPTGEVELVTTHISWVLLAGDYAYKIKRPVRYPFIDLTSLERRRFFCEEELRLNRRFTPELYIEVCRVVAAHGVAHMEEGNSEPATRSARHAGVILDYAVRMRRFSRAEQLGRLLDERRIEPRELEAFGQGLARMHDGLPVAPANSSWGRPEDVQAHLMRNLLECADAAAVFGSAHGVLALRHPLRARLAAAASWLAARRSNGRIRECHGDLHSGNVARVGGRLIAFDCLEYEPALRWIDTADEIAFLTSDLKARDRPLHAHAFRGGYLTESGDYHACGQLALYEAHRALVRAKIAALSAAQNGDAGATEDLRREHKRLVSFAASALASRVPRLLLMSGLSGSGKTWLARQLAVRLAAVHIRSDVERKRRAGLHELAASHSRLGQDLYSPQASAIVYDDLERAAEAVLSGGIPAVVDASFLQRAHRARFAELAARRGAPLHLIRCEAPEPVLRARITERSGERRDSSEGDLGVLAWQVAREQPVCAEEGIHVIRVDTAQSQALELALRGIGGVRSTASDQL